MKENSLGKNYLCIPFLRCFYYFSILLKSYFISVLNVVVANLVTELPVGGRPNLVDGWHLAFYFLFMYPGLNEFDALPPPLLHPSGTEGGSRGLDSVTG